MNACIEGNKQLLLGLVCVKRRSWSFLNITEALVIDDGKVSFKGEGYWMPRLRNKKEKITAV